jgi:hypothetical protein
MSDIDDLLASLHDHLEATEERPLTEDANRWLGEAQAIASDAHESDLDHETTRERVQQVIDLLEEVDSTGDSEADKHVDAAQRAAERVIER